MPPHCYRMRVFGRDLIRGGHYGQRSCEPHLKAEHMAAPTNPAIREESSCQSGAVHTWHETDHSGRSDDVRCSGRTGSSRHLAKVSRLTPSGHWVAWTCARKDFSRRDFLVNAASQDLECCLRGQMSDLAGWVHAATSAVVGSITERTRAILFAGNPPFCACARTADSSGAT